MDWREYQDTIGKIYEQAEGIGTVYPNIMLPDKVTGHGRQIDVWMEINTKGHKLKVLIDAKFRKNRVNVKVVEEVAGLAVAVGAHKAIIVCSNGWTEPAEKKAHFLEMDFHLVTIEDAVGFLEPDKWQLCPVCENDCIIMDHDGMVQLGGLWLWWIAGQCRECRSSIAWCQDCGAKAVIEAGQEYRCGCGHYWIASRDGMRLRLKDTDACIEI